MKIINLLSTFTTKRYYNSGNSNNNIRNVLKILNETKEKLRKSNNQLVSTSADLESKLLVSNVLNLDKGDNNNNDNLDYQLFNKNMQSRIVSDQEYTQLQSYIDRRLNSEPISYIIGYRYFWKHKFNCNHSTLIPRPDSETIIEKIIEHSNDDREFKIKKVLDLGTGTGCLLLSVLDEFKNSIGVGIDKSIDALKVANQNAIELGLNNRAEFLNLDWNEKQDIDKLITNGTFDLIISNPPYISIEEFKDLNPTVTEFEPKTALISDDNGLKDYKNIASLLKSNSDTILSDNGIVIFEIGKGQELDIQSTMESHGFKFIGHKKDLNSIIRCLVFKKKK